jgi:2-polyprenyl-3-methyl-5-hydroxy-6-metoxy-1,4-benzoquinol methylase
MKCALRATVGRYVEPPLRNVALGAAQEAVAASEQRTYALQIEALERLQSLTVNLELMKGEVRAVVKLLEDLGFALAPGAGIAGAGVRVAELREQVNNLDRVVRRLLSEPSSDASPREALTPGGSPRSAGTPFDYIGCERRFRGSSDELLAIQRERYLDLLRDHPPVLDIGCGRGELVEELLRNGVEAVGIDLEPQMVAEAQSRGVPVHQADARQWLRQQPEGSLGSIIAIHVVEHIDFNDLLDLVEMAATRLKPGGVFVAETPNPASLIVLGNSYILDPTHVTPLHPSLMTFICERAGFRDVRLAFHSPAESYRLPPLEDPDLPEWADQVNQAFGRLNEVLFGPQEYAVIATKAPAGGDEPGSK